MTTTITVKALHGWPVKVTEINTHDTSVAQITIVESGQTQDFSVYDGRDIFVHEIQPIEVKNTPKDDDWTHTILK